MGPVLIFDKSTLESLNPDEAVWLDNFFLTNITPLFYIETLADLEKEMRSGRTPEQIVGSLAYKTPDSHSCPNVHHETLLAYELLHGGKVRMEHRPIKAGGQPKELGGKTGIVFFQSPEEEALLRWQRAEFLELERQQAKDWRKTVTNIDYEKIYDLLQHTFTFKQKPKSLAEVKNLTDFIIDGPDQKVIFSWSLSVVNVQAHLHEEILKRWSSVGHPPIRDYAPYFRYVLGVDFFYYLAIASDQIARVRPQNKANNKVDIAYLYYLPFCWIFASNDKLHDRVVRLFLDKDQTYVKGEDLKSGLNNLDQYYSSFPEDIKNQGVERFAVYPPTDKTFLITQLWDKYFPSWRRNQSASRKSISDEAKEKILAKLRQIEEETKPGDPSILKNPDNAEYLLTKRRVMKQKGKWNRFPPNLE